MAASSNQNTLRNSRVRFIPYRRRAFSVPNISPVPEKPVFLHRMLLKMRRVPQEAILSTECVFRTVGGPLRYRMPQKTRRVPQEGVFGTESSHRGKGPVGKTGQEKQGSWGNPVCRITQKDYTKGTPNRAHGTIKRKRSTVKVDLLWELRESNPRPSACKADALNQLS